MMRNSRDRRAVVVMAKRPAPGHTKTRLTPALSPEQAASFYECLLVDTLRLIQDRSDCTPIVAIDAPESTDYFAEMAPGLVQLVQHGEELGDRLDSVMTACLANGYDRVFAVGSDSPDLPAEHLDDAFGALDRDDVDMVLGPTNDGGYYLIGWKQRWSKVVTDVQMSTPQVLEDTLAIAQEVGARVHLSPTWYDIDTPDDLDRLRAAAGAPLRSAAFLANL